MYTATGTLDRNACVREHSPLVRRIALQLAPKLPASVELDDMIQAGLIGLMDAASRWKPTEGTQFETYASQRIRGAMLDELRERDWLSRGARKSMRDLEAAVNRLQQRHQRQPSESEIAAELGMTLRDYHEVLLQAKGYQLIHYEDYQSDPDEDPYLDRHVSDTRAEPLALIEDIHYRKAVIAAIEKLPERERMLMGLYYEQDLNFKEIASVLGVTESRVCQIHSQAIVRLRAELVDWR
jgi:RNA polymerase sigma factor for flagellar operon FliA